MIYAIYDKREECLSHLKLAVNSYSADPYYRLPIYQKYKNDPKYVKILNQMNLK